jgi:serine/threonine protein kinase
MAQATDSSRSSSLNFSLEDFLARDRVRQAESQRAARRRRRGRLSSRRKRPEALDAGVVFCDRYRVLRCLGVGGFSDVYLATDLKLDRRVAVKRSFGVDADSQLALEEAKLAASLDHGSIVHVFDVVHDPQHGLLIIMQFINGPHAKDSAEQRADVCVAGG